MNETSLSLDSIDTDWKFLWAHFGNPDFCAQYHDQYVAVMNGAIVGSGITDAEAREAGVKRLLEEGKTVLKERLCVDFVGD